MKGRNFSTPLLSVVIPSYNRWKTLKLSLDALRNTKLPSDYYEIIVSDSGSEDGTVEGVENLKRSWHSLRLITAENKGKAQARNRGVQLAKGKVILFLDADMIPYPGLLEGHLRFHQRMNFSSSVALLGLEIRVNDEDELKIARENPEAFLKEKPHRASIKVSTPIPRALPWYYSLTGNLSLSREAIVKAGLFDESFERYGYEDLELGYRLHKIGVSLFHLKLITFHLHPYTAQQRERIGYLAGSNLARFYLKHSDPTIPLTFGVNPLNKAMRKLLGNWVEGRIRTLRDKRVSDLGSFDRLVEDLNKQFRTLEGFEDELTRRVS